MDGKEFWLINEKLKQQLKVFPFRAQRGQKGAGEPVWKLNSSKSFPSLQTESTSPVSQRSRSTPLLLNYGFCQPLKWTISIHWYFVIFLLFRCASISWFEVVSNWVSHLPFSASASTGLSDYFSVYIFLNVPILMYKENIFFYEKENVRIKILSENTTYKSCAWGYWIFYIMGHSLLITYSLLLTHMLRTIDLCKALYNSLTVLRSCKDKKTRNMKTILSF